jgi:DNA-binding transcriptional LysR family regulator
LTHHQLRIFSSVAKHLNVTKASFELHLSQPSISQQLKLLQQEYGVKLYKKNGLGIELTPEGRVFLKDIEPILAEVERLKKKFSNQNGHGAGSFSVGGSFSPSINSLPMLLAVFKKSHPQVRLSLQTGTSYGVEQMVLKDEVEIGVITNPSYSPSLFFEPCWRANLTAVVSARHPLAKKGKLTLAELAAAPLIIKKGKPVESRAELVLKDLKKRGFQPNVVMECESLEAVKAAVKAGVGAGLLFGDVVEQEVRKGELKILKIKDLKVDISCFVIYKKEKPLSSHAKEFLVLLRQWNAKKAAKGSLYAA